MACLNTVQIELDALTTVAWTVEGVDINGKPMLFPTLEEASQHLDDDEDPQDLVLKSEAESKISCLRKELETLKRHVRAQHSVGVIGIKKVPKNGKPVSKVKLLKQYRKKLPVGTILWATPVLEHQKMELTASELSEKEIKKAAKMKSAGLASSMS